MPVSSKWSLSFMFPHQNPLCNSLAHTCHMSHVLPCHHLEWTHCNCFIGRRWVCWTESVELRMLNWECWKNESKWSQNCLTICNYLSTKKACCNSSKIHGAFCIIQTDHSTPLLPQTLHDHESLYVRTVHFHNLCAQ
jgi:hypothetical protein